MSCRKKLSNGKNKRLTYNEEEEEQRDEQEEEQEDEL